MDWGGGSGGALLSLWQSVRMAVLSGAPCGSAQVAAGDVRYGGSAPGGGIAVRRLFWAALAPPPPPLESLSRHSVPVLCARCGRKMKPSPGLLLLLGALCLLLPPSAHGQFDDFSLEDALDDVPTKKPAPAPKPNPPKKPADDLDLFDFFDPTPPPPKIVPKPPTRKPVIPMTTKKPRPVTQKPPKKSDDLDLADALDEKNDRPGRGGGGGFSDSDLDDIYNDGYRPEKGKGGRRPSGDSGDSSNNDAGTLQETGTIAGIASALAMALIGAVSSYISYQQKKFCFSIQQGLNAEYVKGEQMEGVVSEEPQVKYSALDTQASAPPTEAPSKVTIE